MSESPSPFSPRVAWELASSSPVTHLRVAEETGTCCVCDQSGAVSTYARGGQRLGSWTGKLPVRDIAISADGSVVAIASANGWVRVRQADLTRLGKFRCDEDPIALALDPNGWHVAVSTLSGNSAVYDAEGQPIARLDFLRGLRYMQFVLSKPALIGSSEEGMLAAFNWKGEQLWRVASAARVGGLACDARARNIVMPAFGAGLLHFDGRGEALPPPLRVEQPSRVAVSPQGEHLLVASLDQSVTLQSGREVRRIAPLGSPVVAVAIDPLGRWAWIALEVGRVLCFDLRATAETSAKERLGGDLSASIAKPQALSTEPTWALELGLDTDRLNGATLRILDQPLRLGLLSMDRVLRVYVPGAPTQRPKPHHISSVLDGVGRVLLVGQNRFVALSDRRVLVYDAATNTSVATEARLVEVTQAQLYGQDELIVIEERERLSRRGLDGKQVWGCELPALADQLAVADERIAVTLDDGSLWLSDARGEERQHLTTLRGGKALIAPLGPGFVVGALGEKAIAWIAPTGQILMERSLPQPLWALAPVGDWVVARDAEGRAWQLDTDGHQREIAAPAHAGSLYFETAAGDLARIYDLKDCLTCVTGGGQILWRHLHSQPVGSMAASKSGTAALLGARLCWFASKG
jgi:hypothetical protein